MELAVKHMRHIRQVGREGHVYDVPVTAVHNVRGDICRGAAPGTQNVRDVKVRAGGCGRYHSATMTEPR